MKALLFIFSLFTSISLWGKQFDGYYITNENDTIEAKIHIEVNMFDNSIIRNSSIRTGVTVFVNEEKRKFKPFEIKGFHIYDQNGISFKPIKIGKNTLFAQVKVEGKLSVFLYGTTNLYGGAEYGHIVVKFLDKEPLVLSTKKKLLKYLNNDYFKERFETSSGNWRELIITFAEDYNKLKEEKN